MRAHGAGRGHIRDRERRGPLARLGPGGITQWPGLPWHADWSSCRSSYQSSISPVLPAFWPARIPTTVHSEPDYPRPAFTGIIRVMADPAPPSRRRAPNAPMAAVLLAFRVVCGIVILLDELVRPLYRPLLRWLAALELMQALERRVGGLSPYLILVLIAVPYAIVEPLKFLALLRIADGHVRTGTVLFLLAHLVSFVLIERIFSAGRAKLMTLPWTAWVIETGSAVRLSIVSWLRLAELKRKARAIWRWLRLRLR